MRARRHAVAAQLRGWLAAPGSLTERLRTAWGDCTVRLLAQRRERPTPGERCALGLGPHQPALVRQVLLQGPAGDWVQARSVCALRATRGAWRALRGLGARPLAQLLYARADIRRSDLSARPLGPASPTRRALARVALGQGTGRARTLWLRQSVFERRGQRLLVAEVFDPRAVQRWPRTQRLGR